MSSNGQSLTKVVEFKISDEEVKARIGGRRIHKKSGRSYHVKFNPPKVEGKDDQTGEPLIQRKDDNPETVGKRLSAFYAQTQPVVDYYKSKGLVATVEAEQAISGVYADVKKALGPTV